MLRTITALLGTLAIVASMAQARASALIANCTMKPNTVVKSMPSPGDEHLFFGPSDKAIEVEVYDQYGGQWAYVEESDPEKDAVRIIGWVLRSSFSKCENTRPWKKQ
jgi:hypothetical protein